MYKLKSGNNLVETMRFDNKGINTKSHAKQ